MLALFDSFKPSSSTSTLSKNVDKAAYVNSFVSSQQRHLPSYATEGKRAASRWLELDDDEEQGKMKNGQEIVAIRGGGGFLSPLLVPRVAQPQPVEARPSKPPPRRKDNQQIKDPRAGSKHSRPPDRVGKEITSAATSLALAGIDTTVRQSRKFESKGTKRKACEDKNDHTTKKRHRKDSDSEVEREERLAERRERRREKKRIVDPAPVPEPRKGNKQAAKKKKGAIEPELPNINRNSSAIEGAKKKKTGRSTLSSALLFCHGQKAKNVGKSRLTVGPIAGVFNKGKASTKTSVKGTRFKPFSELAFLDKSARKEDDSSKDSSSSSLSLPRRLKQTKMAMSQSPTPTPSTPQRKGASTPNKRFKITNYTSKKQSRPGPSSVILVSSDSSSVHAETKGTDAAPRAESEIWDIELDVTSEAEAKCSDGEDSVMSSCNIKSVILNYHLREEHSQVEEPMLSTKPSEAWTAIEPSAEDAGNRSEEAFTQRFNDSPSVSVPLFPSHRQEPSETGIVRPPEGCDDVGLLQLGLEDLAKENVGDTRTGANSGNNGYMQARPFATRNQAFISTDTVLSLERALLALDTDNRDEECPHAEEIRADLRCVQEHSYPHLTDPDPTCNILEYLGDEVSPHGLLDHYESTYDDCIEEMQLGSRYNSGLPYAQQRADQGLNTYDYEQDTELCLDDSKSVGIGEFGFEYFVDWGCVDQETDGEQQDHIPEVDDHLNHTSRGFIEGELIDAFPRNVECHESQTCDDIVLNGLGTVDSVSLFSEDLEQSLACEDAPDAATQFGVDDASSDCSEPLLCLDETRIGIERFLVGKALRLGLEAATDSKTALYEPQQPQRGSLRELELNVGQNMRGHWHPVKY